MIFILIIAILWLLILAGLIYGVIFLLTLLTRIIIDKSETGSFRNTKKYNGIALLISICLSIIFTCYYLFSNPAHNFKTAYIEKRNDKYIITVMGKRNLMVHDPISLFKKEIYIDSSKFEIPRAEGIIDGLEIPNRTGSYKILKGNAIVITNSTMKVSLFYDNYDDRKNDPSTWNGDYKLEWRTQK
jgi:hypothetical protein